MHSIALVDILATGIWMVIDSWGLTTPLRTDLNWQIVDSCGVLPAAGDERVASHND